MVFLAILAFPGLAPARGQDAPIATPHPSEGPFTGPVEVYLSISLPFTEIRYDSSAVGDTAVWDDATARVYTDGEPILLNGDAVIRARGYVRIVDDGGNPVGGAIGTYIYDFNRPPTATVTYPTPGAYLRSGTAYTLTAQASDLDGDALTVSYRITTEGGTTPIVVGPSGSTAPFGVSWTPTAEGAHTIVAIASDAHGPGNPSPGVTLAVTAPNLPPMVNLTGPPAAYRYLAGKTVNLSATANDQDSHGGGVTKVTFEIDGAVVGEDVSGPSYTHAWTNAPAGTHELQAKALDNHIVPAAGASSVVEVTGLARPSATLSISPSGPFTAPAAFTVTATLTDTDSAVRAVEFRRNGTLVGTDSLGPAYAYAASGLPAGNHVFTAILHTRTTDGDTILSQPLNVAVGANQRPDAHAGSDTAIVWPGASVVLDGSRSADPEGLPLAAYLWEPPPGVPGVSISQPTTVRPTASFTSHGAFVFRLIVTDAAGLRDTDEVKVDVNRLGFVTSRLADTALVGTAYSRAVAFGGHPLPVLSLPASKPSWINLSGNTLSGTPPNGGVVRLPLILTNAAGTRADTLRLVIQDPARISADLPDSMPVLENSRLTLQVTAAGHPAPTYQWQRILPWGQTENLAGNSPSLVVNAATSANNGRYRVIVTNGVGRGDTSRLCLVDVKALIRIANGGNPVAQTVTVGQRAQMQVRATGAPTLLYQWFRNGAALGPPAARDSILVIASATTSHAGVYRARVTNAFSDTSNPATFAWSDTASLTVRLPQLDRPKANPAPRDFNDAGLTVALSVDTPGSVIRYTLNNSFPGPGSPQYTGPIRLTSTTTIRARSYKDGYTPSEVFTGTYIHVPNGVVARPVFRPVRDSFSISALCTLSTSTAGAIIRYTQDGSDPRSSPTAQTYQGALGLWATTTLIAYAYSNDPNMNPSDTVHKTYTLSRPLTKAQTPEADPQGGPFTGSLAIRLSSRTDNAAILYTLDGTAPSGSLDGSTLIYSGPITLTQSAVIKAIAVHGDYLPSDLGTYSFQLRPGPVTASPNPIGRDPFEDTLRVWLEALPTSAEIYYTLNDSLPFDAMNRPIPEAEKYLPSGILLDNTYTITAMALMDGVASAPYRFSYTRKGGALNTPLVITAGNAYTFKDSLRILLSSTDGSTIHYTLDGTTPGEDSPKYDRPIWLDTTATLRALALKEGFQPSRILLATFTLVADTPSFTPGAGEYSYTQMIVITTASRKTPIRYTLDGTNPGPSHGFQYAPGQILQISTPTTLKAVALSGGIPGPVRTAYYDIFGSQDTVLAPGQTYFLRGGYILTNAGDPETSAQIRIGRTDSLPLAGFAPVGYSLTLGQFHVGSGIYEEFPSLVLSRSASENRALYRVVKDASAPAGRVYFISGAERVTLSEPGTYFMGLDVAPPVIEYLEERFVAGDSTSVRFKVTDNVHNLLYDLKRGDDPAKNLSLQAVFAGADLSFTLKHAPGVLKPLGLQFSVSDYRNVSSFPGDGATWLPLAQRLKDVQGPSVWRIGADQDDPHDLVGIPFSANPPLTLADLGPGGRVAGFVYDQAAGKYRRMGPQETLVPGKAYWIASSTRIDGFKRASAEIAPRGSARFTVTLKTGWNQVSNPHLDTLYWPFARHLGDSYRLSPVKGLWSYVKGDPRVYVESDLLLPWRGYYVYNHKGDTTIELSYRTIPRPAIKEAAWAAAPAAMSLVFGDAPALRLGASVRSSDGLGFEDEGDLPGFSARDRLRAVRQGRGLASDWVRLERDKVLEWRVLPSLGRKDAAAPSLRVLEQSLPEGYEVWALSHVRGMKFPLKQGESIPVSGLDDDTLLIIAGPAAKLSADARLRRMPEAAPEFGARIAPSIGGPELRLDLPDRTDVRATLWTLRGRRVGGLERRLPPGRYRFRLAGDFTGPVSAPGTRSTGVHFLRIEMRGQDQAKVLALKVLFRD
jgi:hypothetical protein